MGSKFELTLCRCITVPKDLASFFNKKKPRGLANIRDPDEVYREEDVVEEKKEDGPKASFNVAEESAKKKKLETETENKLPPLSFVTSPFRPAAISLVPTCQTSIYAGFQPDFCQLPMYNTFPSATMLSGQIISTTCASQCTQQAQIPIYQYQQFPYPIMQLTIPQTPVIFSYPHLRTSFI